MRRSHTSSALTTGPKSGFVSTDDNITTSIEDDDVDPEATMYYHGLPSRPTLIFRTGPPSEKLTGPEAYSIKREIRPVFNDKLAAVWEDMGTRVYEYLDSVAVRWTTIDVVRFAEHRKPAGPIVLWVGVMPGSLSRKLAQVAALACQDILLSFQIVGVEIAFRESLFRRSGLRLLNYVATTNPTACVRSPLTPALGLRIASLSTPYTEGTGGIYLSAGGDSEAVYVLTARHAVFPPKDVPNIPYHRAQSSQRRVEVVLPGPEAFEGLLASVMVQIAKDNIMVDMYQRLLDKLQMREESGNMDGVEAERESVEISLRVTQTSIKELNKFHSDVSKIWSQRKQRVIGYVFYAPPINVGAGTTKPYTEDWALIQLDRDKINWDKFRGNVIDLGTEITLDKFVLKMMCLDTSPFKYPCDTPTFTYPYDRLFPIQGIVPEDELTHPQMRDPDGEPCIPLIKNGCATNTTIGRGNGIKSFVRDYFPDDTLQTSMEFAILGYQKFEAFSDCGDSGSVIVDSQGRAAALLTGRTGQTEDTDITYATPFEWLLERIKAKFPDIHLYPTTD